MKIVRTLNIYSLQAAWKRIQEHNPTVKPTQNYVYYCYLFFSFYARILKVGYWRMIFHYYADNNEECIIPLMVNQKRKKIRSVSHYGRMDYDDIISSTSSKSFIAACLQKICEIYPHYELNWKNISEQSVLYPILDRIAHKQEHSAAISLSASYEQYYSSLTKHQRQNIRTAYNRLFTDNISFDFQRYEKLNPISRPLWNQCEAIYERRHEFDKVNYIRLLYNRITNPYHHILTKHSEHKIYVINANDIPMAYMAGIYDEVQKTYYVPRLCINEQYRKYSPGIVLINETIKHLISQGAKVLDLMLGEESYKIAMGGELHNNYSLQTTTDELLTHVYAS